MHTHTSNPPSFPSSILPFFHSSILILCLIAFNTVVWAAPPLQIIHTDPQSLTLTFTLPDLQVTTQPLSANDNQHPDSVDSATHITFKDAQPTTQIGHPRLPTYIQSIGIPDGPTPTASISNTRSETRPTTTIVPTQPDTPQETPIIDHTRYRTDRFHPTHPVEITPLGYIRGQRIARLQINPIQYNPARKLLKIYRTLTIRIQFTPFTTTPSLNTTSSSHPFEQILASTLLNYQQAKQWRKTAQSFPAAPTTNNPTSLRFKIVINKTHLYKITANDLKTAGADPTQLDLQTVKLENQGRPIGLTIFDKNQDHRFDTDDSIVFYGRKLTNNRFTNDNVYWLIFGGVGSTAVDTRDAQPKTPETPIPFAFKKTQHFEEDRYHDFLSGSDIKSEFADHYFWTGLTGGHKDKNQKHIQIRVPDAIPRTLIKRRAELRIKLQGATHKGRAHHKAQLRLNNKPLPPVAEWKRQAAPIFIRELDQHAFIVHDSVNILTIIAQDQNETPPSEFDFYLDWFELDYWHTFKATNGALQFNTNTEPRSAGTVQYRVTNLNSPQIDLYQIHDGQIVARLINAQIEQTTNTNTRITFETQVTQPTSYFVIEHRNYRRVPRLTNPPPSTLRNPANQADYIVITHKDFINNIQPLVEFRKSQGLSVTVVDVHDIYNQFSHGIFNPFAIQKFLRYAFTSWQKNAPTYVLLVGDAHYDYKQTTIDYYLREYGTTYDLYPNTVPTLHGWAPNSGETAMDSRFVAVSGDDPLPDMFIGRLSVQTTHELDTMVKKVINYEQNHHPGPWQAVIMQVADDDSNNVGDTIFEKKRDYLINEIIPVAYDTRKVYLKQIASPGRTKQTILNTINQGAVIVEYAGHGGSETWADENILHISDLQSLRNKHLPFIITTTCLNGQFDKPLPIGRRSLSEQFMMGTSGAIGTLSATRLTLASSNAEFDEDLFKSMFTVKPQTLGAIVGNAKINFMRRAPQLWIPDAEQYTLFGDPATRLALPELEIKVELEDTVLNTNKQIIIIPNSVGHHQTSPFTSQVEFHKATDFSTQTMTALALFPNDLDKNPTNDRPRRRDRIQVWQGDYGTIRLTIPPRPGSGAGIIRVHASDKQRSAIGGTKFWIDTPVVYEIRENMDAHTTNTLTLSVQVIDDNGPAGITTVTVVWDNTTDFEQHTTPMIPDPSPPAPALKGGLWYKLQTPIPLPKGGRQVRYQIIVTDTTRRVTQTDRKTLKVPEGPNIAFGLLDTVPLRYTFSKRLNAHTLTAQLVNDGGRPVNVDIEVWFTEGNPDQNADSKIDPDADVLGTVLVKTSDWIDSDTALQKATVILPLKTPLSTGIHKIYVIADPEPPDAPQDNIIGRLEEPRSYDNRSSRTFIVNEFTLKANEELTAFSLDRVFDAHFPANAAAPTPLTVDSYPPPTSFQPDLSFAPIPRVAALRSRLPNSQDTNQDPIPTQAYNITLHTGDTQLTKPVDIKMRFDLIRLKEQVQEKFSLREGDPGFEENVQHLTEQMSIYAWQAHIKAWKRLPSHIQRDQHGTLIQEPYVTPPQTENTNPQPLDPTNIRIDASLTPLGKWIIFLLDPQRYEVLLHRNGEREIEKLGKTGQLGKPFLDEILGIELNIPHRADLPPYEFGDILKFETELSDIGNVRLGTRSHTNRGNGTASVEISLGPDKDFQTAHWLIFFTNNARFELRNTKNQPVRYRHGAIIQGRVNQRLILNHLGIELFITSGDKEYELGDKIKYTTATVSTISTQLTQLTPLALISSNDRTPPILQLWANGIAPTDGDVIPPRPKISMVIADENGIDIDTLTLSISKNNGPYEPITSTINSDEVHAEDDNRRVNSTFTIPHKDHPTTIPVLYKPILYIGRYILRIAVNDLNQNPLRGEEQFQEFRFRVEEQPDFEPPQIQILANGHPLTHDTILHEQQVFTIHITDNHTIDPKTVQLSLSNTNQPLTPIPPEQYQFTFHSNQPTQAKIVYRPDLPNDHYQIQVSAADTSENTTDPHPIPFQLDEPIDIKDLFNVPNPMHTKTVFTYTLTQAPDTVTIKIYTIAGRLVRTLTDASDNRNYNETYWDGRDQNGVRLANGTYLYRITVQGEYQRLNKTGKLAILR